MKIRFRPEPKPGEGSRDRGFEVLYAPARRAAFQLRWYLLVLLVASPLLYGFARFVWTAVIVEAPGVLSVRRVELRSSTQGFVQSIEGHVGDALQQGQVLVRLANPEWEKAARHYGDEAARLGQGGADPSAAIDARIEALQTRVEFYRSQLAAMQRLRAQGAATAAEVASARATFDAAQDVVLSVRAEQARERSSPDRGAGRLGAIELEKRIAEERIAGLDQTAPAAGRLAEVLVEPGEYVTWGTPLAIVTSSDRVVVTAYLPPRHVRYATPGQDATIQLPDGTEIAARVAEGPESVLRLPAEMAAPLVSRKLALILPLEPTEPLPTELLIEHLPVDIRFRFSWRKSFF